MLNKTCYELTGCCTSLAKLASVINQYNAKYSKSEVSLAEVNVSDIKEIIYESSLQLAGEFTIAKAMSDVASNMEILNEDEANKIDNLTKSGEKILNTAADVVSLTGGIATIGLMISNNNVSKNTQLSVNLAAILPQVVKFITKRKNENKRLDKALKYAHDKASRLSIHAFLIIEMKSTSATLDEIKTQCIKIKTAASGELGEAELLKLSREYISLVENVDRFYSFDILNLKNSVSDREGFQIYTPETIMKLTVLVQHPVSS